MQVVESGGLRLHRSCAISSSLIKYLRESRELKPFQDFVEYFGTGVGVVNPVVVLIRVAMEVVVLQKEMSTQCPSDVSVYPTSDAKCPPKISGLKPLLDLQHDRLLTLNNPSLQDDTPAILREGKGVINHKWVFTQSDFMDCPVVVPAIPVVRVFSRSNLAP